MGEIGSVEPIVISGIGGRPVTVGEQPVTIEQGGIIERSLAGVINGLAAVLRGTGLMPISTMLYNVTPTGFKGIIRRVLQQYTASLKDESQPIQPNPSLCTKNMLK